MNDQHLEILFIYTISHVERISWHAEKQQRRGHDLLTFNSTKETVVDLPLPLSNILALNPTWTHGELRAGL